MSRVVSQMKQRIQRKICDENNVSTASTISSRRTTPGNELLTPESSNSVSTIASLDMNLGAINKHLNQNDAWSHDSVLAQASRISRVVATRQQFAPMGRR